MIKTGDDEVEKDYKDRGSNRSLSSGHETGWQTGNLNQEVCGETDLTLYYQFVFLKRKINTRWGNIQIVLVENFR